ncbi:MAG: response regulator transcription factor [Helicobacter sp.]|nr:response regulator transcription factor [Helicobacter sp.]
MGNKILLVEDDAALQEIIAECLEEEGYEVVCCNNAREASEKAYEESFDLFLFDVMIPYGNGFELLKEIRTNQNQTPCIFITALNQIKDLEKGFESGCEDYLKKPFELAELLVRIKAVLERRYPSALVDFGNGYCFDSKKEILYFEGKIHKIPNKLRELLRILLQNEGNFVANEVIFSKLWKYEEEPSELALRVYIKDLRHIVGKDNIKTRRGEGYCYTREA